MKSVDKLKTNSFSVEGKALKYGLEIMSTAETTRINKELASNVNELVAQVASKPDSSYRERKHVEAVFNWSRGDLNQAAQSWEDVLVEVVQTVQQIIL